MFEADLIVGSMPSPPDFLSGGGEMGAVMRAHDWSASPFGPPADWPQSLRAVASLMLDSRFPMFVAWGDDLGFLYNDAYAEILGDKHPRALGARFREIWSEIWPDISPLVDAALAGEATYREDLPLTVNRRGADERAWFTFSYSPARDESGRVAGMFCACTETTDKVLTERRIRESETRLSAVLESVSDCFYAVDPSWRVTVLNRAGEQYFGVSRDRVIGRNMWDLFPQGLGTEFERDCRRAMDEGASTTMEARSVARPDRFVDLRIGPTEGGGIAVSISDITDRKTGEERLRESEARFRNMADHAPVMMWVTDPTGYCTYLNRAWYAFTGQSEGEAEGYGWLDATHPDDKPLADEAFRSANAAQESFRVEYRLRRADGTYRWAIDAASPRFGEDGVYLGYVGSVIDIDERRESEVRLSESEVRYRALVEAIGTVVWTTRPDGSVVDMPMWRAMTGQTKEQVAGHGWLDALHPDDRAPTAEAWDAALAARQPVDVEYRVRRADGAYRWYNSRGIPVLGDGGELREWVGVCIDIDNRKAAEDALAARSRELERVMLAAPAAIYINDRRARRSVYVNEGVTRILGYTAEDVGAISSGGMLDLVHPDDLEIVRDLLARVEALPDGGVAEAEYRLRRKDGPYIWLHDRMVVLDRDPDGAAAHVLGFSVDATERHRHQQHQQLLINELNHRVKNTLAIVQGIAQQSFKGVAVATEARKAFEGRLTALSAAHNALTRVNWEAASINEIVTEAVEPYRSRASAFEVEGPDLPLAPKTAVSLALAVHELATNAVKYGALSGPAGQVEIRWRVEDGRLKLVWRERGGPPVEPPAKRGFGSRMIERGLAAELGGDVRIDFERQGVVCTVDAPLPDARG